MGQNPAEANICLRTRNSVHYSWPRFWYPVYWRCIEYKDCVYNCWEYVTRRWRSLWAKTLRGQLYWIKEKWSSSRGQLSSLAERLDEGDTGFIGISRVASKGALFEWFWSCFLHWLRYWVICLQRTAFLPHHHWQIHSHSGIFTQMEATVYSFSRSEIISEVSIVAQVWNRVRVSRFGRKAPHQRL